MEVNFNFVFKWFLFFPLLALTVCVWHSQEKRTRPGRITTISSCRVVIVSIVNKRRAVSLSVSLYPSLKVSWKQILCRNLQRCLYRSLH